MNKLLTEWRLPTQRMERMVLRGENENAVNDEGLCMKWKRLRNEVNTAIMKLMNSKGQRKYN